MSAIHCFFCGGKECKYENWKLWTPDKYVGVNAIDGLFSSWITDNILAMQRPSTRLIKEYDLVKVFLDQKIMAIFNLQSPFEHASCGDGIESTGFSYIPEHWIDNGISYYNFGWTDMEVPDMQTMLNIVNVMAFSHQKGKKLAVHCHAGLGRTALAIACYLVFAQNFSATNAILLIRGKRPLSVQTKKQAMFVAQFEAYLKGLKVFFPGILNKTQTAQAPCEPLNFENFMENQRWWLSLEEVKYLRPVPKVVHAIVNRIIELCSDSENETEWYNVLDEFVNFEGISKIPIEMMHFQVDINNSEWGVLKQTKNTVMLIHTLLHWIVTLADPLITDEVARKLSKENLDERDILKIVKKEEFETINLLMSLFRQIPSISKTTLDFAFERLAIYITSYRESLVNYKRPADKEKSSINQIYEQGDQLVSRLKTKVSDSINSGLKNIPSTYLSNLTTLPQLPQIGNIGRKLTATQQQKPAPQKAAPETNVDAEETNPKQPASSQTKTKPSQEKEIKEPEKVAIELPSIEGVVLFLKLMYQNYRLSPDNRAVLAGTKELAFPLDTWRSPTEILFEEHKNSTSNLAVLLKPNNSSISFSAALTNNLGTVADALNNYITKPIRETVIKHQQSSPDLLAAAPPASHIRSGSTPVFSSRDQSPASATTTPKESLAFVDQLSIA